MTTVKAFVRSGVIAAFMCMAGVLTANADEAKGAIIWCSPQGDDTNADGSEEKPFFDVQRAIDLAKPGDRILMIAGRYVYDKRIDIDGKYGTADQMFELWGYGGQAILDFSGQPFHEHADNPYQGVRLTSSYWHLKNLDICNASDNGLLIERNRYDGCTSTEIAQMVDDAHHNIVEMCNFYRNGDSGLQIKNLGEHNKIINCDSYYNCDTDYGDADGFAPKISVGTGNYFYGCRAWQNSDDGWDAYYKIDGNFGDDMVIVLENCITYKNGFLEDGSPCSGNGNGFKCGSVQGATNMYLNRCIAVKNRSKGFDQNNNKGDIILNNCTAYDNGWNYGISFYPSEPHTVRLTNCLAIGETGGGADFKGAFASEFVDLSNHEELIGPRDADGNLPTTTFAHLREGSSLIDAGQPIAATNYRGIEVNGIDYSGAAPDFGAYEFDADSPSGIRFAVKDPESISVFRAQNGVLFLTVEGASEGESLTAKVFDTKGMQIENRQFPGSTTSVDLRGCGSRVVIIVVEGSEGFRGTVKAVME